MNAFPNSRKSTKPFILIKAQFLSKFKAKFSAIFRLTTGASCTSYSFPKIYDWSFDIFYYAFVAFIDLYWAALTRYGIESNENPL